MKRTYSISGMHCIACVGKITEALQGIVAKVEVSLDPPRATLEDDSIPVLEKLNETVAKVGSYRLKAADELSMATESSKPAGHWLKTYQPLFIIVGMIAAVSLKSNNIYDWMLNFMAGFFLVFGAFKLLDLPGFRDAYASYDLLAKRCPTYGLIYPFLELALGFMFLFRYELTVALWFSIALMGFSSLGVLKALRENRKIRCACLGTSLNLPMSTITLIEDLGMVIMAILMLIMI